MFLCITFICLLLLVEVAIQVEVTSFCCSLLLSSPLSFAQLKTALLGGGRDEGRRTASAFLEQDLNLPRPI